MTLDAATGFGDAAERYAMLRPAYPPALFAFLRSRLHGPRRAAIDLGAGPGKASIDLLDHFEHVTAVEPDVRMLAFAPRHERLERVCCKAEEADFPEGRIDCVIAATSFHWMDQDLVCARVARWLRPGGVFFPFLYGPFSIDGAAHAAFKKHWALWAPYRDKRLGAKADYSTALRACGQFSTLHPFTNEIALDLSAGDAAGLLLTASYARAYMAHAALGGAYVEDLARDLAPYAPVRIKFPLGGVLGVRA